MPAIVLTGNTAGGAIQNSMGIATTINGIPIAVSGDAILPHEPCPTVPIHCNATTTASKSVTINGIPIVVSGDAATCGHAASGSAAASIE